MKEKIILTDIDGVWLNWEQSFTDYLDRYYKIKRKDSSKYEAHGKVREKEKCERVS